MERVIAVVSGKVQGVWYRDFAVRSGLGLGLTGTTMNMRDGTVRVVAEGPREKLDAFVALLRTGPPLADVTDVALAYAPATGEYADFSISYE